MFALTLIFVAAFALSCQAFTPSRVRSLSSTRVYERFDFDFKNPKIESDKAIFTEKQLREFTASYSEDYRFNPLEFVLGLFNKDGATKKESSPLAAKPTVAKSLKPTISLAVLEEKTAQYVKGTIDAKKFLSVLQAAFGDKLKTVLPEIVANLPAAKAAALTKVVPK